MSKLSLTSLFLDPQ